MQIRSRRKRDGMKEGENKYKIKLKVMENRDMNIQQTEWRKMMLRNERVCLLYALRHRGVERERERGDRSYFVYKTNRLMDYIHRPFSYIEHDASETGSVSVLR
jgi:hypothetical protein